MSEALILEPQGDSMNTDWIVENFSVFEKRHQAASASAFHGVRKQALETYQKTGFPTAALEEWKYTDPSSIINGKFKILAADAAVSDSKIVAVTSEFPTYSFVFVNGILVTSPEVSVKGVTVVSLTEALVPSHPLNKKVTEHLTSVVNDQESFAAINTSFTQDGLAIFVDKNCSLDKAIELTFITTARGESAVVNPRVLCVLEQGASATIVERFRAEKNDIGYFTNAVLECKVGKNAHFNHYRVQEESEKSFHVSTIQASVENDSTFKTHTFSFGGKLVRNHVNVAMNGSNANVTMNGLSVLAGDQHIDNTTLLDHAMPHCESLELYKGIYGDRSQGVFSGTIVVREDAQKTNAIQSNRSILLSNDATVNTKPQLKIWADDVKCTHGATIGQLDDEALFYIQARGVGKKEAKMMLVQAFASQIIAGVEIEEFKDELIQKLEVKLARIA